MSLIVQIALTFAVLSIISIGGANATLPEIHRQVVDIHHWMDDATFAHVVAIGQTAPGPNVLIVGAIGWQLAGALGLLVALSAIVLPSSALAVVLGRLMVRYSDVESIGHVRKALTPIALGFMLASGYIMTRAAYAGVGSIIIVVAVACLVATTRVSPFWGILGGALIGIGAHRLQMFG